MDKEDSYIAVGTMSGTSCDGIDISIVETDGKEFIRFIYNEFFAYDERFSKSLLDISKTSLVVNDILEIEHNITLLHVDAINKAIQKAASFGVKRIDIIGFHGHTVLHRPDISMTWQIGNASLISALCECNVISDFRKNDMSYGGQGAPLVPIFHRALFSQYYQGQELFVINIGGIANITHLYKNKIHASDVGPGNCIIDNILYKKSDKICYDIGGQIAFKGNVNQNVIKSLSDYFKTTKKIQSFDREFFSVHFFENMILEDAVATAAYFTALCICDAINSLARDTENIKIIVSGGGRKNLYIIDCITQIMQIDVIDIDKIGDFNGDFIESGAFAYLAVRSLLNLHITETQTTGVRKKFCQGGILNRYNNSQEEK
ncbi:anhydro-N-acetylmuramic acid kinase [Anaplasmataceae bacterium AB001_6]|nr:anhydro-N-acetylmuramic acid kinase [Anaplasmataceae bacterium AB001_6]